MKIIINEKVEYFRDVDDMRVYLEMSHGVNIARGDLVDGREHELLKSDIYSTTLDALDVLEDLKKTQNARELEKLEKLLKSLLYMTEDERGAGTCFN